MARLLIQSAIDHQFLHWSPVSGSVAWTPSLATALCYGIADDAEQVQQLVEDYCEGPFVVVDLDNVPSR